MNRATLTRLGRLERRAGLDGSLQSLSDEALFQHWRCAVEAAGGAAAVVEMMQADGVSEAHISEIRRSAEATSATEWFGLATASI